MRNLGLNKSSLWLIEPTGTAQVIDNDGFYTGEIITTYSYPIEIRIALYPATGSIVERIFGKDEAFDKVAISNRIILTKDSLLFINKPIDIEYHPDYYNNYDYKVYSIKQSLNTFQYGLRSKT